MPLFVYAERAHYVRMLSTNGLGHNSTSKQIVNENIRAPNPVRQHRRNAKRIFSARKRCRRTRHTFVAYCERDCGRISDGVECVRDAPKGSFGRSR